MRLIVSTKKSDFYPLGFPNFSFIIITARNSIL